LFITTCIEKQCTRPLKLIYLDTVNISVILSTENLELNEDTAGSVRCNAKFEDVAAEENYTLQWYDENDVMVSTNQNNGDYQIVGGSSSTERTAYLFVSGRGNFTENNLTIIFATLQNFEGTLADRTYGNTLILWGL